MRVQRMHVPTMHTHSAALYKINIKERINEKSTFILILGSIIALSKQTTALAHVSPNSAWVFAEGRLLGWNALRHFAAPPSVRVGVRTPVSHALHLKAPVREALLLTQGLASAQVNEHFTHWHF